MRRWFLPYTPDLVKLLCEQADVTISGMEAFVAWSHGELAQERAVRDAEHEADNIRRRLETELRAAFTTPIEPEDLYELSERLDAVINGAKNAVREAEVMAMEPNEPLAHMATHALESTRHLGAAFATLVTDPDNAIEESDAAVRCERDLERAYRTAMSDLLLVGELGAVMGRRELYRRYARIGESLERVADRIHYAVVKTG